MAEPTIGDRLTTAALATEIVAELVQYATSAQAAPARITTMVRRAGKALWNNYEFAYRLKTTTATIAQAGTEIALPSDFGQNSQCWMWDADGNSITVLRGDNFLGEMVKPTATAGTPKMGVLITDTTKATPIVKLQVAPASDKARTYTLWYWTVDPWTLGALDTAEIMWPVQFDRAWYLLAAADVHGSYGSASRSDSLRKQFESWLDRERELAADKATAVFESAGDGGYTVTSLLSQIRASIVLKPGIPEVVCRALMRKVIRDSGKWLWNNHPWRFRRRSGTLSISAAASTAAVPADFEKLDSRWIENQDATAFGVSRCRFYEDPTAYQSAIQRAGTNATGVTGAPYAACVIQDSAIAAFTWKFIFSPTADRAYTFPYWYLAKDPWTVAASSFGDDSTPSWPTEFNEGWRLRAMYLCQQMFGQEPWMANKREWTDWMARQQAENDATIAGGPDVVSDGYADVQSTTSGRWMAR